MTICLKISCLGRGLAEKLKGRSVTKRMIERLKKTIATDQRSRNFLRDSAKVFAGCKGSVSIEREKVGSNSREIRKIEKVLKTDVL